MVEIKFCGMTRPADARLAASLGARYVGAIFAESPRKVSEDAARGLFDVVPKHVARVGVFGSAAPQEIADRARRLSLDVVQLHGDPDAEHIAGVRQRWSGQVWAVQRVAGTDLPATVDALFDVADAVVLDARVADRLGGTGVTLPWEALRDVVTPLRSRRARLVLAGGLTAENVRRALDALTPDIVDVSSGVETEPGVKDPARMRAFRDAVRMVAAS
jgi:phosphoribosylanthranilate isomerase